MYRMMIAAAAAVLFASAAPANTISVYLDGGAAHVRYSDLDLQSQTGRTKLVGRIHMAADMLCADLTGELFQSKARSNCYRVAVTSGIRQMNEVSSR
jgi:UrcA family protein